MITWRGQQKTPSIEEVRELTLEEVRAMPRGSVARVQKLRDSHHMAARLVALGLSNMEVAQQAGYSYSGISVLRADPAFQELITHYREKLTGQFLETVDEYYTNLLQARNKSLRQINDRLDKAEEQGEDLPLNQLHAIHSDAADRTGYPKRKDVVVANLDFADSLDKAIERSRKARLIEHQPAGIGPPAGTPVDGAGVGAEVEREPPPLQHTPRPQPLRRRA